MPWCMRFFIYRLKNTYKRHVNLMNKDKLINMKQTKNKKRHDPPQKDTKTN